MAELIGFGLALMAFSAVAGVLAGLLGVGGGIVIVPGLFFIFGALGYPKATQMHVAVATSLATIVFTSVRSVQSHNKRGAVDWDLLRAWAPWMALGAGLGVLAASALPTRGLTAVFGLAAFAVAVHMAFGGRLALGSTPPSGLERVAWAGGNGFLSAMMGIGGGTFGVPILGFYRVPIHRAVATAAGFGVAIAAPAAIGFLFSGWGGPPTPPMTVGYVNLLALALITPITVLTAPIGVKLAHSLPARPLQLAFAFFLAMTALNMLRKALLG